MPITVKLAGAIKRYKGRHQPETEQPHLLGSTWAFTAAQPTSMCSWGPSTTVCLSLVVRNDGRGLLGSDGSRRHGMGVMGMRERAVRTPETTAATPAEVGMVVTSAKPR